jgi:hypothetical protein
LSFWQKAKGKKRKLDKDKFSTLSAVLKQPLGLRISFRNPPQLINFKLVNWSLVYLSSANLVTSIAELRKKAFSLFFLFTSLIGTFTPKSPYYLNLFLPCLEELKIISLFCKGLSLLS